MHQLAALTKIAMNSWAQALGHLAAAANARAYLLERSAMGDDIEPALLERASQGFTIAVASGYEPTIQRMADAYPRAFGEEAAKRNSSLHVGMVLRCLSLREVESASQWLAPVVLQDERTTQLIEAIIEQDREKLRAAITDAVVEWKKRIRSERLQKFPDAVCDDRVLGWVRLAERVWGQRPVLDLSAAQIPPEILDAVAEPVECSL
jgi:hypothetical protein